VTQSIFHIEFQDILSSSCVNLTNGGGLNERKQFQNYLSGYKFIVYDGLNPDRVNFKWKFSFEQ